MYRNKTLAMALLLFAVLAPRIGAEEEKPALSLTFGIYPSDKSSEMYKKFLPVIEALQADVGTRIGRDVDIRLHLFRNYAEGIEALQKGDVDFVRFGPASYVSSERKNPRIRLLAMEHKKGTKRFKGVIVVRADSEFKTLADLKGCRFAFGDKNSTIGRYLAQAELVKAGVYAKDFDSYQFLGRHDKVAEAVRGGQFDAGALKISTLKKLNKDGKLRVLHSFDNVTKPWVARAGLEDHLFQALRQALFALKDEAVLKDLKVSGFTETSPDEYELCREGMKVAAKFDR